jgi:hypothetical protein
VPQEAHGQQTTTVAYCGCLCASVAPLGVAPGRTHLAPAAHQERPCAAPAHGHSTQIQADGVRSSVFGTPLRSDTRSEASQLSIRRGSGRLKQCSSICRSAHSSSDAPSNVPITPSRTYLLRSGVAFALQYYLMPGLHTFRSTAALSVRSYCWADHRSVAKPTRPGVYRR